MDLIMMTAIAFVAVGFMVSYALRPTEDRVPLRIRVETRRSSQNNLDQFRKF